MTTLQIFMKNSRVLQRVQQYEISHISLDISLTLHVFFFKCRRLNNSALKSLPFPKNWPQIYLNEIISTIAYVKRNWFNMFILKVQWIHIKAENSDFINIYGILYTHTHHTCVFDIFDAKKSINDGQLSV